jgi:FixJ family two-component response regulator
MSPSVWVVDDEPDVLDALAMLLGSEGITAVRCQSGMELLERLQPGSEGCILLDLRMPGMSGLEVQRELARRGFDMPIVFLSGHGDIPVAVSAIQAGALDFLEKPVRAERLLEVVDRALAEGRHRREKENARRNARDLLESLSPREAEVAELILGGLRTPEIADRLELSRRTVDMHRSRLLKRLGARTSAEAARILKDARELAGGS